MGLDHHTILKVVVPLHMVDEGASISKVVNGATFTVQDEIIIYGDKRQIIKSSDDTRFLVDNRGNITATNHDIEVMLHITAANLYDWLEEQFNENESK